MSQESFTEANVSFKGKHLFATAQRSGVDSNHFAKVVRALRDKFPASEGYSISITHWETRGVILDRGAF